MNTITNDKNKKDLPVTNGLASCGVYARRKFCGNLKVLLPVRAFAFPRPNAKPPTVGRKRADSVFPNEQQQKNKTKNDMQLDRKL